MRIYIYRNAYTRLAIRFSIYVQHIHRARLYAVAN